MKKNEKVTTLVAVKKSERTMVLIMAAVLAVVIGAVSFYVGRKTGNEDATIKWQQEVSRVQERTAEAVSEMYMNLPQLRGKLVGKVLRAEIPYNGETREYTVEFGHDKMWPSWCMLQK